MYVYMAAVGLLCTYSRGKLKVDTHIGRVYFTDCMMNCELDCQDQTGFYGLNYFIAS